MNAIDLAYLRFARERFPLPSASTLDALERRIGVTFSPDYRQFILDFNEGYFSEPEIAPVGAPPLSSHRCTELARRIRRPK
ncbi:MAG: SMI1/KNR4 family protein [Planctomycetia bacterium]|nr:SMI1/KNR4 family protein [Planctomycetia bacterium]